MFLDYVIGFFVSMVPVIELKGSILYMIGRTLPTYGEWTYLWSFLIGLFGSTLLAPILLLLFKPVIAWMKGTKLFCGFAEWLEKHFKKKADDLQNKANGKAEGELGDEARKRKSEIVKYVGLFVWTAIPLPLTGCCTASVVASFMELDYKKSILVIFLGNVVAGICITLLGGIFKLPFFSEGILQ